MTASGHDGESMTARERQRGRPGFTLLELLVTVTIIAIAASMVAPMISDDSRLRVMGASTILASDIELAQVVTISFPSDPVVVKFDAAKATYWLAYAADPDTPMTRSSDGEPYVVHFGEGRVASTQGVSITLDNVTNDTIAFEPSGGLVDFTTTPRIQLSLGGGAITLWVSPMTGSVLEFDGTIDELKKQ